MSGRIIVTTIQAHTGHEMLASWSKVFTEEVKALTFLQQRNGDTGKKREVALVAGQHQQEGLKQEG
jgi:hypothetical protein